MRKKKICFQRVPWPCDCLPAVSRSLSVTPICQTDADGHGSWCPALAAIRAILSKCKQTRHVTRYRGSGRRMGGEHLAGNIDKSVRQENSTATQLMMASWSSADMQRYAQQRQQHQQQQQQQHSDGSGYRPSISMDQLNSHEQ